MTIQGLEYCASLNNGMELLGNVDFRPFCCWNVNYLLWLGNRDNLNLQVTVDRRKMLNSRVERQATAAFGKSRTPNA